MTLRRWESWVTCRFGLERHEQRLRRHFFRWSARLYVWMEPSRATVATSALWNATWPDEKIRHVEYEVRRAP